MRKIIIEGNPVDGWAIRIEDYHGKLFTGFVSEKSALVYVARYLLNQISDKDMDSKEQE